MTSGPSHRSHITRILVAIAALGYTAGALQLHSQPCPAATAPRFWWGRHTGEGYAIEIRAPRSFTTINYSRRGSNLNGAADTIPFPFVVSKTAVTRLGFYSPTAREVLAIRNVTGRTCMLQTAAGELRLIIWRRKDYLHDGRDTTHFNAWGDIRNPGMPHVVVHVTARDSLGLLENLQVLQTMRRLKRAR